MIVSTTPIVIQPISASTSGNASRSVGRNSFWSARSDDMGWSLCRKALPTIKQQKSRRLLRLCYNLGAVRRFMSRICAEVVELADTPS